MDLNEIVFLASLLVLGAIFITLIRQNSKLKQENKRWKNGEILYKGSNLCSTCSKQHKPSCPRATLFLDECKDYISPEEDTKNNQYEIYESPFR